MTRFLFAFLGLSTVTAPALAQPRALPPCEIRADGSITFSNTLKLGKGNAGKTIIAPDSLQILGAGSTGDVSGMSVTALGRLATSPLATILGRTVSVEDFRRPADGGDWAPGIRRALAHVEANGGGAVKISTSGYLRVGSPIVVPKSDTLPPRKLVCDSKATTLQNTPELKSAMFEVGGDSEFGGSGFDVEECSFAADNTTTSFAFNLRNANNMNFRRVTFRDFVTAIASRHGYALLLDDSVCVNVGTCFYSSTGAHNFVARGFRTYGGNYAMDLALPTDNVSVVESDFEYTKTALRMNGGTSLRWVGNYTEHTQNEPILFIAPMYGADISNNWIALNPNGWTIFNMVGGQIKGNQFHAIHVNIGTGTVDVEIADNQINGGGTIPPSPYQAPALLNNWIQQANYSKIGFRKGRDGKVHLRGNMLRVGTGLGVSAFMLPPGYRPVTARTFVAANTGGTPTRVSIDGSGSVTINAASGDGSSPNPYQAGLDGISFEPGT